MEEYIQKVSPIINIIKDYYGEDRVDVTYNTIHIRTEILIYFPKVTISNESDQFINIKNLYVKIILDNEGLIIGDFCMLKSTYTNREFYKNYIHSHCPPLSKDWVNHFGKCCLGNGPIRTTCNTLTCSIDLDMWELFCYELDKYTQIESTKGVPYVYLAHVNGQNLEGDLVPLEENRVTDLYDLPELIIDFVNNYLLKNYNFKYSYIRTLDFAYSNIELFKIFTTLFEEYINKSTNINLDDLNEQGIIQKYIYKDNSLFYISGSDYIREYSEFKGKYLFTFKGKKINLELIEDEELKDYNIINGLDVRIFLLIKTKILNKLKIITHVPNSYPTTTLYL